MSAPTPKAIDKSGWGPGPWQSEPDRIEWRSGDLPCLMVRQPKAGHWCGYVGVPPGHPWHGKDWDLVPADVHGGITYAEACQGAVCHVPAPGEPDDVWWLGFDCTHHGDLSPGRPLGIGPETYRTVGYVRAQVEKLAAQVREAA